MGPRSIFSISSMVLILLFSTVSTDVVMAKNPPPGEVETGLAVWTPENAFAPSGDIVVYRFRLRNLGELADAFVLEADVPSGWDAWFYTDNITNIFTYQLATKYSPTSDNGHLQRVGTVVGNITLVMEPFEELTIYIGIEVPRSVLADTVGELNLSYRSVYNSSYSNFTTVNTLVLERKVEEPSPLAALIFASVAGIAVITVYWRMPRKGGVR